MTTRRVWLAAEYVLLFVVLVGAYAVADVPGGPIPPLVLLSVVAAVHLRRSAGVELWRAAPVRAALPGVLARWAVVAVAMTALVAVVDPASLFALPRTEPWLWAVLTLAGGWLFARRYQRTGSLAVVTLEHAAYGLLIFTVGLGEYFYRAA